MVLSSGNATAAERVVVDLPLPARSVASEPAPVATDAPSSRQDSLPARSAVPETVAAPVEPAAVASDPTVVSEPASARKEVPEEVVVQFALGKGQSLYQEFETHGIDRSALIAMVRQDRRIKKALRRLWPGQRIQVTTLDGRVQDMLVQRPGPRDLLISRDGDDRFGMQEVADHVFDQDIEQAVATTSSEREPGPEPKPGAGPQPERVVREASAMPSDIGAMKTATTDAEAPTIAGSEPADPSESHAQAETRHGSDPTALHRITVKRGDSLFRIFRRLDIPPQDLANLLAADKQAERLKSLRPGQELALGMTHDRRLHSVSVDLDEERTLLARRSGTDDYTVQVTHHPLERRVTTASAVIENSLFLAGQRSGLSDRVIMELTEIFGWDVDFALDVRAGDRFTVIHEEMYKDGEKVRDGPILAAEFVNRGRSVRAIRFVDDTGRSAYYSPDGLSMRKAFLRTPVRFSRISSRFSRGRMHPVLQRMRAHKGVDYAAPTGTPINATGDGRIIFAGRKGGYGRTVIIQHGSTYTTLYAHMSRLHRRARQGARVRQGDTIGYVGRSGLATGPHLHYEFRVRGRHADPLRVKLPKALPIEARYKAAFKRKSRPLVIQLDTLARTSLASSD